MNHRDEPSEHRARARRRGRLRRHLRRQGGPRRPRASVVAAHRAERGAAPALPQRRFVRETRIAVSEAARASSRARSRLSLRLEPRERARCDVRRLGRTSSWTHALHRAPATGGARAGPDADPSSARRAAARGGAGLAWPALRGSRPTASRCATRTSAASSTSPRCASTRDRRAGECVLPAAGLPWFMALFGRDSLITSYQALPFVPELARTTLRALARPPGARECDDFRDAEPGKILHELRLGELAALRRASALALLRRRPTPRRCSSSCSTSTSAGPATRELVRELEGARPRGARLDRPARRPRRRRLRRVPDAATPRPAWRTSAGRTRGTRSCSADGRRRRRRRATCEIQGYAYDAKRRAAPGSRARCWDDAALADRLERGRGRACSAASTSDFWLPDARLLRARARRRQAAGRHASPRTSGTCCGAASSDDDEADAVVRALIGERLFSGWGVRTMADGRGRLQPDRVPQRHRVAARQLAHRRRAWRRYGRARGGRPDRGRAARRGRATSATGCRRCSPATRARSHPTCRCEYPTACSRRRGRPARRCCSSGRCWDSSPFVSIWHADPRLPPEIGRLALRELAGPWGKVDVETTHATASRRPGPGE